MKQNWAVIDKSSRLCQSKLFDRLQGLALYIFLFAQFRADKNGDFFPSMKTLNCKQGVLSSKLRKKYWISFWKIVKNKQHHMKVLLNSFQSNLKWSHTRVSPTDSKGATTFIDSRFDSGSEMVKARKTIWNVGCFGINNLFKLITTGACGYHN